jgi:methyl-accepting chemotaxis protein
MRFITSSVRRQLLVGFAAVVIVFGIGVVVSIVSISSVTSTLTAGTQRVKLADTVSTDTYNMQGSQLMNVLTGGGETSSHAGDVALFRTDLAALGRALHTRADRRGYDRVVAAFARWSRFNAEADTVAARHELTQGAALTSGSGAANLATDALSHAANDLAAMIAREDARTAASSRQSATVTAIGLGLVAVLIALIVVALMSRRIAGGVRQMLRAAEGLSRGEIDQRIDVGGHDEIGAMARAFSGVIDYLRETAGAARQVAAGNFTVAIEPRSEQDALGHAFIELRDRVGAVVRAIAGTTRVLNDSSGQMASTTDEVGRAITEIADSVGHVAQGAEQQVRAVEQARAMSEEMVDLSRASTQAAGEAAQVAVQTQASADQGERAVARVDVAMQGVQAYSQEVTAAIRDLGEKSHRIGGIVDTITSIAEQTNLLALNAAIEAARAGEQGRGFAVVAEEVRKLAEESQSAAGSIAQLVTEIRTETTRAVVVVEDGATQTDEGVQTVADVRDAFQQIRQDVATMAGRIEEIAGASGRILESAERMQESVGSVVGVAEQSAASSEEVSAATEQTSASTQQIASSAQQLSHTADELSHLIEQFTLADE